MKKESTNVVANVGLYERVVLLLTTIVESKVAQDPCIIGKSITLTLSHQINSTGYNLLDGRLEQPAEAAWHMHVDLRTICGASSHTQVLVFNLTGASGKAPVRVHPGYVLREGFGYFRLGTQALKWTAARDACARDGATLAFATSREEAHMLATQFNFDVPGSEAKHLTWYGVSDLAEEGKYVTVTGETLSETGYASFLEETPNGKRKENCIFMYENSGLIDDGNCLSVLAFICKVPL